MSKEKKTMTPQHIDIQALRYSLKGDNHKINNGLHLISADFSAFHYFICDDFIQWYYFIISTSIADSFVDENSYFINQYYHLCDGFKMWQHFCKTSLKSDK